MEPNSDDILRIANKNFAPFESGKEGFIFKSAAKIKEHEKRWFASICMQYSEYLLEAYQIHLETEMQDPNDPGAFGTCYGLMFNLKQILKEMKDKDREGIFMCYNGFRACASSVAGFAPLFTSKELPLLPSHMILSLFFQRFYGMLSLEPHHELKLSLEQIIPFTNTCAADIGRITAVFDEVVTSFFEEQVHDTASLPLPYGVKVDIHDNPSLDRMKSSIECMMKAKLDGREGEIVYNDALSSEQPFEAGQHTTILFHVTVLRNDAFLGFFMDPEKMHYCHFVRLSEGFSSRQRR